MYGTIGPSANPQSTYSIDGSIAAIYIATNETSIRYRQQFFQSQPLTDGVHTLLIAVTGGNGPFWLDYLEYTTTTSNPSTTQTTSTSSDATSFPPTSSSTSTDGLLTTSITPTITQPPPTVSQTSPTNSNVTQTPGPQAPNSTITQTSTNSTIVQTPPSITQLPPQSTSHSAVSSTSGKSLQIGLIVGGAIIGALLIAAVAFFFIRRSWRSHQESPRPVLTATPPAIRMFILIQSMC